MDEAVRKYNREQRAKRIAAGKCAECRNMAEPGTTRCTDCKARRRKAGMAGKAPKGGSNA